LEHNNRSDDIYRHPEKKLELSIKDAIRKKNYNHCLATRTVGRPKQQGDPRRR